MIFLILNILNIWVKYILIHKLWRQN